MQIDKINVRCSGKLHQISLTTNGALVLHSHTKAERNAENVLVALGGQVCRCVQILEAWQAQTRRGLPDVFMPSLNKNLERKMYRKVIQTQGEDLLQLPIHTRIMLRIHRLAITSLEQCDYRESYSRWVHVRQNRNIVFANEASICGYSSKARHPNPRHRYTGNNSNIDIRLKMLSWYANVYKKGLAVVDGVFVVDVIGTDDDGTIHVLAGRQTAGLSIEMRRAMINFGADGRKTLCWSGTTSTTPP